MSLFHPFLHGNKNGVNSGLDSKWLSDTKEEKETKGEGSGIGSDGERRLR